MEEVLSKRVAALVATAMIVASMLAFGSPAFAQEEHTSCQGFGNGVAALTQSEHPFGQEVVIPGPANEDIHGFHVAFCEPKS